MAPRDYTLLGSMRLLTALYLIGPRWGAISAVFNFLEGKGADHLDLLKRNGPPLVQVIVPRWYFSFAPCRLSSRHSADITAMLAWRKAMEKQGEGLGPIQPEIRGKACQFCGGKTYQLVLRFTRRLDDSILSVRCRRCGHPRSFDAEFKRILRFDSKTNPIWAMLLTIRETIRWPFRHLQACVDRKRKRRKSLQMLALSGAVRPSHVELRYATSLLAVEGPTDSFQDASAPPTNQSSFLTLFVEFARRLILDLRSLRPYLYRGLSSLRAELESRLRSLSGLASTTALVVAEGNGCAALYERAGHGIVEAGRASNDTGEQWVRGTIQSQTHQILEEDVTTPLGGIREEHRGTVAPADLLAGSGIGSGKPNLCSVMNGTITVLRPKVRNLAERFEREVRPLFTQPTREVGSTLPEPYLEGLATGDFDVALRNLLGDGAPISKSSLQRLKVDFEREYDAWIKRDLSDLAIVYWWAAGLYVKAGIEEHKSALLTIVGALTTGEKMVLACESGKPESKESWLKLLLDLKHRGLRFPRLTVADGRLGLWAALGEIHPTGETQGCWNRKITNVLNALPKEVHPKASELLKAMPCAKTRTECERRRDEFVRTYGRAERKAVDRLVRDWERMVKFYEFPQEHWRHIRTTNIVVSPFASARIRTNASRRYKRVEGAKTIIWKMLRVAERSWRNLHAPELLPLVYAGITCVNGTKRTPEVIQQEVAA